MENTHPENDSARQQSFPKKFIPLAVVLLLVVAAIFWSSKPSGSIEKESAAIEPREESGSSGSGQRRPSRAASADEAEPAISSTPKPMKLEATVLVRSAWNSSSNAFGLDKPPADKEGATVGPSSVAYANGFIYVLDNANKRVLRYDDRGNLIATIALPTRGATDITVDKSGTVIVVDHHADKIYRIEGDVAVLIGSVPMRKVFPIGTKFDYDSESNQLTARDVDTDGLAKIDGNRLVVPLGEGKEFPISFEAPVACVEEVMTDSVGIIWVLFTLEGDYRMRRVARVDPARGTVGVAELDVWFAFDSTRHMAPAHNGIYIFAGDEHEGRLISYSYSGQ